MNYNFRSNYYRDLAKDDLTDETLEKFYQAVQKLFKFTPSIIYEENEWTTQCRGIYFAKYYKFKKEKPI